MDTFTITHSCGHDAEHTFSGPDEERPRRERLLRAVPCKACVHATRAKARARQGEALGLPQLDGTAEDNAWADAIRAKAIPRNQVYQAQLLAERAFEDTPALQAIVLATAEAALSALTQECRAAWWIEHRFEVLSFVRDRIVAALKSSAERG